LKSGQILFSPRETSRHDLRFRIVDRAADQMIPAIPKRDHVTVRRISKIFSTSLEKINRVRAKFAHVV
jgi:hypothetical protein